MPLGPDNQPTRFGVSMPDEINLSASESRGMAAA
jgi:hypothetical protein